jgi:hypothetical protein
MFATQSVLLHNDSAPQYGAMMHSVPMGFFGRLPKELRQMIYKWAATDNSKDIHLSIIPTGDTPWALQLHTVTTLLKLQNTCPDLYNDAIAYRTSPLVRWVFDSGRQPHIFIFKAFRKHAPPEIWQQTTHAYLPQVTMQGLGDPWSPSCRYQEIAEVGLIRIDYSLPISTYLHRLQPNYTNHRGVVTPGIIRDIDRSMIFIPHTLPVLYA